MSSELLRATAFCAYLLAWLVFAIGAIASGAPRLRKQAASPLHIDTAVVIGTILQITAPLVISYSMRDGPLKPQMSELIGVLALAPLAAALFVWALRSASAGAGTKELVTRGAYARLRHPIYLAFLGMLVATGLLVSDGLRLGIAIVSYLAGSELRIASEEAALAAKFSTQYEQYRHRTPWRYLPGLR